MSRPKNQRIKSSRLLCYGILIFCMKRKIFRSKVQLTLKNFPYIIGKYVRGILTPVLYLQMYHSRPLFRYFYLYNAVNRKCSILPMTGFEPRTSWFGSDRSTNCVTTTAQKALTHVCWNPVTTKVVVNVVNLLLEIRFHFDVDFL